MDFNPAHMGNIKYPDRSPDPIVFRDDATELNRHIVTGKFHHSAMGSKVFVVERSNLKHN